MQFQMICSEGAINIRAARKTRNRMIKPVEDGILKKTVSRFRDFPLHLLARIIFFSYKPLFLLGYFQVGSVKIKNVPNFPL